MEERAANLQALRALSPAYAGRSGELTAILQYVFQAIVLGGCGKAEQSGKLLKIAVEEMHHLEKLGALLVRLGVSPVFTACPPYPVAYYSASNVDYSRPYAQMLEADICAEREAIACYTRILAAVKSEEVHAVIEPILADEERHLAILKEMRSGQ